MFLIGGALIQGGGTNSRIYGIYTCMGKLGYKNNCCIYFTEIQMYLCIETLTKFSYNFLEHSKAWKQFWNILLIKGRNGKKWESPSNKNKQSETMFRFLDYQFRLKNYFFCFPTSWMIPKQTICPQGQWVNSPFGFASLAIDPQPLQAMSLIVNQMACVMHPQIHLPDSQSVGIKLGNLMNISMCLFGQSRLIKLHSCCKYMANYTMYMYMYLNLLTEKCLL